MSNSEYLSVTQYAAKHGISAVRARLLARDGRISAIRVGSQWAIPADAPKPPDERVKSGKYVNWRKGGGRKEGGGVP